MYWKDPHLASFAVILFFIILLMCMYTYIFIYIFILQPSITLIRRGLLSVVWTYSARQLRFGGGIRIWIGWCVGERNCSWRVSVGFLSIANPCIFITVMIAVTTMRVVTQFIMFARQTQSHFLVMIY